MSVLQMCPATFLVEFKISDSQKMMDTSNIFFCRHQHRSFGFANWSNYLNGGDFFGGLTYILYTTDLHQIFQAHT